MTAWQIDNMWEAAAAEEWERLNEPDEYENQMIRASHHLTMAAELLDKVEDLISCGIDQLEETPMGDELVSFHDEIGEIRRVLKQKALNYERGVRE